MLDCVLTDYHRTIPNTFHREITTYNQYLIFIKLNTLNN